MDVYAIRLKNLTALQAEQGLSRKDLAARLGMETGQLNHLFMDPETDGHRNIGIKMARRIEDAFEKSRGWLDQSHEAVEESGVRYELPDVIPVRVMEAEASMGPGRELIADAVVGKMEISREWLRRNLPSVQAPGKLAVITAYGDSMEPTFKDGDILLVDRGVGEVKLDAVYVLGRQDQLFVKRVQRRLNGDLVIKSDNPLFENEVVQGDNLADVRVLGRVVWSWNGRRL